ncbi:9882_t:CDS:2 [Dentiscutata heterogama]|uniref:9882_t:CDS:1 n=1 Tax=Dentiscutata heterogama TaxID=1316150 RepID=A0ACA9KX10_9GLOM|nr:9882_t:CDS:2 [Dentiscutata heterogama]
MSSVFTAFCFIKTVSGNDKFLTGTAVYRVTNDENEFRELTYKGFTGNSETLIIDFEKNSIVLMIGRYVYHQNSEYLSLIQTIPLSSPQHDSTCAPEDLPLAFPLLLYTAPAITNSYKFNDTIGRQSFMLSKKLYNPVTDQKAIESDVIVSYTNANGRYDSLKESLKKSVISAVGRLKLTSNSKIPHIISSEIEWSYAANDLKSSNKPSIKSKELNTQLDLIEEHTSSDKPLATNLKDLADQI